MIEPDILDTELIDEELLEDKNSFHYDPEKINIVTREPTIEQVLRRINEEALDLAPDFQRQAGIWNDEAKSRLIESILIRIPLPAFYIDATDEEKWLVVDGLQRLSALKQFVSDKKLKLTDLEYLIELNDKTYDELERKYQRRILETQITVYSTEKGTPDKVKYNIFKRINTGGLALSPQELRHALNPGKATKFLEKLANSQEFTRLVKLGESRKDRMDDREFILSFLAFKLTSYKEYQDGDRDTFLHQGLVKANKLSEAELDKIESNFKKSMVAALYIFGDYAFRKQSNKNNKKYPLNKALFETWSVKLSELDDQEIKKLNINKKELIKKFIDKSDNDKDFFQSISQAANKVQYRFTTIENIIKEVLS
ncbi:hypothetical protein NIES267_36720 [Calothrix parasitica NIES-267]|uniref:GmrSD restriction endonucleases N-terminal domain-containing protein n=1 Tax=Calothrix parasitica NIES-267 TaxID=1973488 RepID=A0A1Z4LSF5_9CYAN|nr:hypothetical protein NIES267_36720 [Calothrix parasitica NIES-267]